MKAKLSRRSVLSGAASVVAAQSLPANAAVRPIINDASNLNPTSVATHWKADSTNDAFIERLRFELKDAARAKRPVAVGVARHSMGGQSIPRDGSAISMTGARCVPDIAKRTFTASAGTRWSDVIAALDKIGFSPAVMQSNHDFGVASTFCVNAHGWPVPYGPFGSTVKSVDIMIADGTIVTCSREDNADLFAAAMGGYGLFGIITRVEAEMVENVLLRPTYERSSSADFAEHFIKLAETPEVKMLYGRLSVAKSNFFDEALTISYRQEPTAAGGLPPTVSSGAMTGMSRRIYRAQIGSEFTKHARWFAETSVNPRASAGIATRNDLMNEPVVNLASDDTTRTDILHEYFVSPSRFREFIKACQDVIPNSGNEFLNVTLRYIRKDETSLLAFANETRIAAVMSFSQEISPRGEVAMMEMTEELIDRITAIGGAFYLPYRLHARHDQVRKAYPRTDEFIAAKKRWDPDMLFRNAMWEAYFAS